MNEMQQNKLDGIEVGATADQTADEILELLLSLPEDKLFQLGKAIEDAVENRYARGN